MRDDRHYSIGELAQAAGVTRRTVRFYVQRGLLPAPLSLGRGRHYRAEHLRTLVEIKRLQLRGVSLEEIRVRLGGHGAGDGDSRTGGRGASGTGSSQTSPAQGVWRPFVLAATGIAECYVRQVVLPGFELHVTAPGRPLAAAELAELGTSLQRLLEDAEEEP